MSQDIFLKALKFRHACKEFDPAKKVEENDLRFILETGRLSPSAFGLEHWKFIVVKSEDLKRKLYATAFNQKQLITCSHLIVIVGKLEDLSPDSDYVKHMFTRLNYPKPIYEWLDGFYRTFYKTADISNNSIVQCHIAAANMMTAAASIGIDSCPIGGFEPDKVHTTLELDTNKYIAALILPIGYRKQSQPKQHRLPFEEVVEFR